MSQIEIAGAVVFEAEDISVAESLAELSQKPIAAAPSAAAATPMSVRIGVLLSVPKRQNYLPFIVTKKVAIFTFFNFI